VILTLDLGTSTTKAVVWDGDGPRTTGVASIGTTFGPGQRAEQDASTWWPAVVAACARAAAGSPEAYAAVEAVGFAAARQTFVAVDEDARPLGPALLWSDGRARAEAAVMAAGLGGVEAVHRRTGSVLDGRAVAAKAVWLAADDPERWAATRWLLSPRDVMVAEMTGVVVTDATLLSAAGLGPTPYGPPDELLAVVGFRLPPVLEPDTVAGSLLAGPAAQLGLPAGLPVVVGAGDRACEVLGSAATADRPMVSWGTTANVSVPVDHFRGPVPDGLVVTRGAAVDGGWLLEGGLSGAGTLLTWLSSLTGLSPDDLMTRAAAVPAGAGGALALPWWGGARAPWWRDRAAGAFVGLTFDHDAGHLARALLEAVAFEVDRARDQMPPATALALTGGQGPGALWPEILTAVTGLPGRRRGGQAASTGAALLTARAVAGDFDLDRIDPEVDTVVPDPAAVAAYADLRRRADDVARAVIALAP